MKYEDEKRRFNIVVNNGWIIYLFLFRNEELRYLNKELKQKDEQYKTYII